MYGGKDEHNADQLRRMVRAGVGGFQGAVAAAGRDLCGAVGRSGRTLRARPGVAAGASLSGPARPIGGRRFRSRPDDGRHCALCPAVVRES